MKTSAQLMIAWGTRRLKTAWAVAVLAAVAISKISLATFLATLATFLVNHAAAVAVRAAVQTYVMSLS